MEIASSLQKQGADLVSLSENIDTTSASGKMVFRMLAVLSEFERDQISERTFLALGHKRSIGMKTGGKVPFGYVSNNGFLTPENGEQATIRLIAQLRKNGLSLRHIAKELHLRQIRTKSGLSVWNPKTVASLLKPFTRQ